MQSTTARQRVKSPGERLVERRIGRPIPEALRDLYEVKRQDQEEIAEAWGIDRSTVSRWMAKYDVQARIIGPRKVAV